MPRLLRSLRPCCTAFLNILPTFLCRPASFVYSQMRDVKIIFNLVERATLSYTYDYTRTTAEESSLRRYWRFMKMTLTRLVRAKTFHFDGKTYEYLYHMYNKTWKNERGVE